MATTLQERLLEQVGFGGKGLNVWLRDVFLEQHGKPFYQRLFIWHVSDGSPRIGDSHLTVAEMRAARAVAGCNGWSKHRGRS